MIGEETNGTRNQHPPPANTRLVEKYVADCASLALRPDSVDACLSVAVIHHFRSFQKRLRAVKELVRVTRIGGYVLIVVWAFEQTEGTIGARKFESQDVFVPWVYQQHFDRRSSCGGSSHPSVSTSLSSLPAAQILNLTRYYHVFTQHELLQLCQAVNASRVCTCRYEANNWFVVLQKV